MLQMSPNGDVVWSSYDLGTSANATLIAPIGTNSTLTDMLVERFETGFDPLLDECLGDGNEGLVWGEQEGIAVKEFRVDFHKLKGAALNALRVNATLSDSIGEGVQVPREDMWLRPVGYRGAVVPSGSNVGTLWAMDRIRGSGVSELQMSGRDKIRLVNGLLWFVAQILDDAGYTSGGVFFDLNPDNCIVDNDPGNTKNVYRIDLGPTL